MSVLAVQDLSLAVESHDPAATEDDVILSSFEEDLIVMMELYKEAIGPRPKQKDDNTPLVGWSMYRNDVASEIGIVMAEHIYDDPNNAESIFNTFKAYAPTRLEFVLGKTESVEHIHSRSHTSGLHVLTTEEDTPEKRVFMDAMLRVQVYRSAMKSLLVHGLDVSTERWLKKRDGITKMVFDELHKSSSDNMNKEGNDDEHDTNQNAPVARIRTIEELCEDIQEDVLAIARQL